MAMKGSRLRTAFVGNRMRLAVIRIPYSHEPCARLQREERVIGARLNPGISIPYLLIRLAA